MDIGNRSVAIINISQRIDLVGLGIVFSCDSASQVTRLAFATLIHIFLVLHSGKFGLSLELLKFEKLFLLSIKGTPLFPSSVALTKL